MAEYIEVDQMWKCETCFHHRSGKCALGMFGCDHGESYRPAYSKLKKADVAPVVRCRDCKYRSGLVGRPPFMFYMCTCAEGLTGAVRDKNFCSYGERKDGDS